MTFSTARFTSRRTLAALLLLAATVPAAGTAQSGPERLPDVHFVPTPMEVVDAMLSVTNVGKDDVVYDLGSGDGRIVITAASRRGARGIGIDIDPPRIAESRLNADSAGVADRVEFRQADLFQTDLRPATVVTLYLLPRLNVQLRPKLFDELRVGTQVVSHSFDMGDWDPDSTISVNGRTVYYWVMPAQVAGAWSVQLAGTPAERVTLRLEQQYQMVTGTAAAGREALTLGAARMRGDRIDFDVTSMASGAPVTTRYTGHVDGDRMSGTAGGRSWTATRTVAP